MVGRTLSSMYCLTPSRPETLNQTGPWSRSTSEVKERTAEALAGDEGRGLSDRLGLSRKPERVAVRLLADLPNRSKYDFRNPLMLGTRVVVERRQIAGKDS
jgi:hypothetical protein